MQTMPKMSWRHRVAADADVSDPTIVDVAVTFSVPVDCLFFVSSGFAP
jgi:hypothetical protein